jgi:signal peptidase I
MNETGKALIRDYGASVAVAVLIAILIRIFVIEAYRIPSAAMHPTLEPGDTIFVEKWGYWGSSRPQPARGDVVVFTPPGEGHRDYIKRVIGVSGDTVEMKDGKITLNGKVLTDPAIKGGCSAEHLPDGRSFPVCWEPPMIDDFASEKVPDGEIFVVGDLRSPGPSDTKKFRSWGLIPVATLKGRARWVWLSWDSQAGDPSAGSFPKFRFERMFKKIE